MVCVRWEESKVGKVCARWGGGGVNLKRFV